jgi:membrane protease YdiL (CAAX protease family)
LSARALFLGSDGQPHAPWRILLFLFLSVACVLVVMIALRPVLESLERLSGIGGTAEAYGATIAFLLAHWMTFKTFDKRAWSFVWLDRDAAKPARVATGALLGGAPIGIVSLLLVATGLLAILPSPDGSWVTVALQTLVLLLPAALYEELLSRGYIFATLREWLGARTAIIATSLGFGLLHLFNPNVSVLSIALVTIAGLYLAIIMLALRSLYAAWIAHFAWNWVMAAVLHVPVSGLPLARPDYQIADAGPDWITGGPWGPEGGAAAGLGMLGGIAYLYWRSRLSALGPRPSETEKIAQSREPTAENHSTTNDSN